jgi:hypothetical protein
VEGGASLAAPAPPAAETPEMGPKRLLPDLISVRRDFCWSRECAGAVVGVDAFILLYEAVKSAYEEVVVRGEHLAALAHFKRRLDTLLIKGVRPVFVFDGRKFSGKQVAHARVPPEAQRALAGPGAAVRRQVRVAGGIHGGHHRPHPDSEPGAHHLRGADPRSLRRGRRFD